MTKDEAFLFFSEFLCGGHHIPGEITPFGDGWQLHYPTYLSTFDCDYLTRLVLLAHDKCVRVEIAPCMRYLKICIWKRNRGEAGISQRHPTITQAIDKWRSLGHEEIK